MKGWIGALLLTIGLSVIFVPTVRQLWAPSQEMLYVSPRAEVAEKTFKEEKQMLEQEKVMTEPTHNKEWNIMDVLDKIIGWITSLAGTCMMFLSYADKRKGKKNGRHKRP